MPIYLHQARDTQRVLSIMDRREEPLRIPTEKERRDSSLCSPSRILVIGFQGARWLREISHPHPKPCCLAKYPAWGPWQRGAPWNESVFVKLQFVLFSYTLQLWSELSDPGVCSWRRAMKCQ